MSILDLFRRSDDDDRPLTPDEIANLERHRAELAKRASIAPRDYQHSQRGPRNTVQHKESK